MKQIMSEIILAVVMVWPLKIVYYKNKLHIIKSLKSACEKFNSIQTNTITRKSFEFVLILQNF